LSDHGGSDAVRSVRIEVPASTAGFLHSGSVSFSQGIISTRQGSSYAETRQTFHRPADVSVQIKQNGGSAECGVVCVFPQRKVRHSGYNAGTGWWRSYFGAGVDGSIAKRGSNNGATSSWHTVRINVAADGKVYFYLDGALRYTATDNKYKSGVIRLGKDNCRSFQYRNLVVSSGGVTCTKLSTLAENNFSNRGDTTLNTGTTYTYTTSCGYTVRLSGWSHTRNYAKGFLRNSAGTGRAVVEGLKVGKAYNYKIYQYASAYAGTNAYQVNGVSKGSTTSAASDAATATGTAVADGAGKVTFTFTRQTHHIHLSGIAIAEASTAAPTAAPTKGGSPAPPGHYGLRDVIERSPIPQCVPGGVNNKNTYDSVNKAACFGLSQEQCESSLDCTYHSSCTASIPLSKHPDADEIFKLFPSLKGKNFTCSCDETIQLAQVQQVWGSYLAGKDYRIHTNNCKAMAGSEFFGGWEDFCPKLTKRLDCVATPWCEDAHIDAKQTRAQQMMNQLMTCAKAKCSKCGTSGYGTDQLLDMERDDLAGNCPRIWGGRRLL